MDTSWIASGSCRLVPAETMFPSDSAGVVVARRICAACEVKPQCLSYALANRLEHGVWGGTSSRERRRIITVRPIAPSATDNDPHE
jgi:WhiB family transcriptional regulator, redox-sensing transcriptional regulator